jgi:hypothetical protein
VYPAFAGQGDGKRLPIQTVGAWDYAMIESVKIQNFRCFSELEVHGLKPINIIVGENASGKSAFLEAIYISSGALPNSAYQFREARQLALALEVRSDSSSYWSLWEDLFHGYDLNKPISIQIAGAGSSRTIAISRIAGSNQTIPLGVHPAFFSTYPLISFEWTREGAEPVRVVPRIRDNKPEYEGSSADYFSTRFFGPHISDPPQKSANHFSDLSKVGKLYPVVDALRAEFPFIKTLSLEIDSGIQTVFAEIEGQSRRLPVGLISDGIQKLLSILLTIATKPNGTILMDQIEDGFYFKKMASTWKVIHKFAKENGTQIFATTHSQECLAALLSVLEANEEDFALLRASRSDDSIRFSVSNGRRFASALSQEFELR